MQITTEFDVGDEVFFIYKGKLVSDEIVHFNIHVAQFNQTKVIYTLSLSAEKYTEGEIFENPEKVFKHLQEVYDGD